MQKCTVKPTTMKTCFHGGSLQSARKMGSNRRSQCLGAELLTRWHGRVFEMRFEGRQRQAFFTFELQLRVRLQCRLQCDNTAIHPMRQYRTPYVSTRSRDLLHSVSQQAARRFQKDTRLRVRSQRRLQRDVRRGASHEAHKAKRSVLPKRNEAGSYFAGQTANTHLRVRL